MRYHFHAQTTNGKDFVVDVDESGEVVHIAGIGESRVRYHTRKGGIDGLIRAMQYSHSVHTSREDDPETVGLVELLGQEGRSQRTGPKDGRRRVRRAAPRLTRRLPIEDE
jgi:hypothetical protein